MILAREELSGEISNSYSDFTETDIINRNSKIIDSFVNFLRVNQLLKE